MTISATTNRTTYTSTGSAGPYSVTFPMYDQTHATVILTDSNGVDTVQTLTTDYTFSAFVKDNMGRVASPQITFTGSVASGTKITILLTPPGTQITDIKNQNKFFATSHEAEFDLLAQKTMQQSGQILGSLRLTESENPTDFDMRLPKKAVRAGGVLAFDDNGNPIAEPGSILAYVQDLYVGGITGSSGDWQTADLKVVLTPGTWEIGGEFQANDDGTACGITLASMEFSSSDGVPSNITGSGRVIKLGRDKNLAMLYLGGQPTTELSDLVHFTKDTLILAVTNNFTLYATFRVYCSDVTHVTIPQARIHAKRISLATS
jgi:hypothetical protein